MTILRTPLSSSALFPLRHRIGFFLILAAAMGLFHLATGIYRRQIDQYQYHRIRYTAERALSALERGDPALARREVALLATERPIGTAEGLLFTRHFSEIWEGPVMRNRVLVYERLTAELLKHGMLAEAEEVGWKTQFEYHIASRPFEMLIPWNLIYQIKLARADWSSVIECAKILAAHGLLKIDPPDQLSPIAYPFDPHLTSQAQARLASDLMYALKVFYEAETPQEFELAASHLQDSVETTTEPVVRGRLQSMLHRAQIQAGHRDRARQMLQRIRGRRLESMDRFWQLWPANPASLNLLDRDPLLMDYYWRDRPTTATLSIAGFVDSFKDDARVQIEDPRKLRKLSTGYFMPGNNLGDASDGVLLHQNISAVMNVTIEQPVFRIFLATSSTVVLGIHPILLLKIDELPVIPIYCDSVDPAFDAVDVKLMPGRHRFEIDYINDAGFDWSASHIKEDRNLSLYRMALIHTQPGEP